MHDIAIVTARAKAITHEESNLGRSAIYLLIGVRVPVVENEEASVYSMPCMRISAPGRILAIIALYAVVFTLLVVVRFPSDAASTIVAGPVVARVIADSDGGTVRSAELTAAGLRLVVSERFPLVLEDAVGGSRRVYPVSYSTGRTGIALVFDDGTVLEAGGGDSGVVWSLKPAAGTVRVRLRYVLDRNVTLMAPERPGSMKLMVGGSPYTLDPAEGTALSADGTAQLSLDVGRNGKAGFSALMEVAPEAPAAKPVIVVRPMPDPEWTALVAAWREHAWSGLSGPGFDAQAAVWKLPASGVSTSSAFSEAALLAYEAEAMRKGLLTEALGLVNTVKTKHAGSLTWKSVPFVGRTMRTMATFEDATLRRIQALERAVQEKSKTLFYDDDIMTELFDRAPESLTRAALALAASTSFEDASVSQVTAILRTWLDASRYMPDADNPFSEAPELVERILVPALAEAGGFIFLLTDGDNADVMTTLRASGALIEAGRRSGNSYGATGRRLAEGVLSMAAPDGSLPVSVKVSGGKAEPSQGRLAAWQVYPYVGESPYYPRVVSLYKELGKGAWLYTCAPELGARSNLGESVFEVRYPLRQPHYIVMYGFRPFARIQLYGLDYNMDAAFETYNASGYYYRKAAGALYIKMVHKSTPELIRLVH